MPIPEAELASSQQLRALTARVAELENQLENKSVQLEYVSATGLMLTSLLDLEQVLAAMMEMAIRAVSGEVGAILLQENGSLKPKVSWGLDYGSIQTIIMPDGSDIANCAQRTGRSILINSPRGEDQRRTKVNTALAVPLTIHRRQVGVIVVVNRTDGVRFSSDDRDTLETLLRFAAVAIENAKLMQNRLEQQKLKQELAIARQVQQALLPRSSAELPGARIETIYQPAGQVGGDYFDIIPLADQKLIVLVGDVSSKGVPAALLMSAVRSVFRMEAQQGVEVARLIRRLNSFLCDQVFSPNDMFVTLVYAYFDLKERVCTYCNAGHLPPLHYSRKKLKRWRSGGTALGMFADSSYREGSVTIRKGDRVLLYTDGLTEARDGEGRLYGAERLQESLAATAALPAAESLETLVKQALDFASHSVAADRDDITALMVELT